MPFSALLFSGDAPLERDTHHFVSAAELQPFVTTLTQIFKQAFVSMAGLTCVYLHAILTMNYFPSAAQWPHDFLFWWRTSANYKITGYDRQQRIIRYESTFTALTRGTRKVSRNAESLSSKQKKCEDAKSRTSPTVSTLLSPFAAAEAVLSPAR